MKVSNVAESDDQVFVSELELAWTEPRADRYDLFLQIDALDLAHDQVGVRTKGVFYSDVYDADRNVGGRTLHWCSPVPGQTSVDLLLSVASDNSNLQ